MRSKAMVLVSARRRPLLSFFRAGKAASAVPCGNACKSAHLTNLGIYAFGQSFVFGSIRLVNSINQIHVTSSYLGQGPPEVFTYNSEHYHLKAAHNQNDDH